MSDFSSSFKENNSERILGNERHESSLSFDSEKLCTIIKNVNIVREDVAKLIKAKKDETESARKAIQKDEALNEETETLLAKVTLARSIADIEWAGFTYSSEQNELRCSACVCSETEDNAALPGIFSYDQSNGLSFLEDPANLPEKFRSLKRHVKRHTKKSKSTSMI